MTRLGPSPARFLLRLSSSLCGGDRFGHFRRTGGTFELPGRNEVIMEDDVARAARAKKGSPFLSTEQAGYYLGLSARKMQAMRAAGTGPGFRRHSRYIRYHIDDLDAWSKESGSRVRRNG